MLPEIVKTISQEFLDVLEKHFPGISEKTFDGYGEQHPEGSPALMRMQFCVYIELLKCGFLKGHL